MSNARKEVLEIFRKLHRTRQQVFRNDEMALAAARNRINEEFKSKKDVIDETSIRALIQHGKDCEAILRADVIQAEHKGDGVYRANITKDTAMLDNIPYDGDIDIQPPRSPNRRCKK